jgi:hypothetical protein
MVLLPGFFLAVTVLSINLVGDGLRDMLDPRLARRDVMTHDAATPPARADGHRSLHALPHARRRRPGGRRRVAVARAWRDAGRRRGEADAANR